jgi:hypothetical protein
MNKEKGLAKYYKMRVESGWGKPPVKPDYIIKQEQLEFDFDTYGGGVENFATYKKSTKE